MIKSLATSSITNEKKYRSMMAGSMENNADHLITEIVLGSTVSSVSFDVSSLAVLGYKHLQIRYVAKHSADQNGMMQFNGDTGSNYWWHQIVGNGSSASSYGSNATWMQIGYGPNSSTIPTASIIDILDFSSTNKNKTIRTLTGCAYSGTLNIKLMSGSWSNTAAITSISMSEILGGYQIGSRFSLYASKG